LKVETTPINPVLPAGMKPIGSSPLPAKLVRTRLSQSKLTPARRWPNVLSRLLVRLPRQIAKLWGVLVARSRRAKSLVVSESATLGDRRIVAVVQFERQRFLIGCGPATVTLLARLSDAHCDEANSTTTWPDPAPSADGGSL
jgi:hypothetical protein